MRGQSNCHRPHLLWAVFVTAGALSACGEIEEPIVESTSSALTEGDVQGKMNKLYDMNNVLKIEIQMSASDWAALRGEQPKGGYCAFNALPAGVDEFNEYSTTSVKVTGSAYLTGGQSYTGVTIKKKSFCGSFTDGKTHLPDKPSIKLKFASSAESSLGTRHLTLNNSVQDSSFIRQTLGYYLFNKAGLPHSRANFAQVWVNGTKVDNGIYINVEPVRDHLLANTGASAYGDSGNGFTHTTDGNGLYEFAGNDFSNDAILLEHVGTESASPYQQGAAGYQEDLKRAIAQINGGLAGMTKVVDVDQFIKMFAMEFLLKHWDGYTNNRNNTYFYNDAARTKTPNPAKGQIRFKMIPSGLDQILQPDSYGETQRWFRLSANSVLGGLVRNDSTNLSKLVNQIKTYRESVFGRDKISGDIQTYVNLMKSKLSTLGIDATAAIAVVMNQVKLARSAAYIMSGFSNSDSLYVLDKATGDTLHASNVVHVGSSTSSDYEVVHQAYADSSADRWLFGFSPVAVYRITNEAYGRYLHCAVGSRTPNNHLYMYTTTTLDPSYGAQDFLPEFEANDNYTISGYFMLSCSRGGYLRYGNDDAASDGRQRVYQSGEGTASYLSWY